MEACFLVNAFQPCKRDVSDIQLQKRKPSLSNFQSTEVHVLPRVKFRGNASLALSSCEKPSAKRKSPYASPFVPAIGGSTLVLPSPMRSHTLVSVAAVAVATTAAVDGGEHAAAAAFPITAQQKHKRKQHKASEKQRREGVELARAQEHLDKQVRQQEALGKVVLARQQRAEIYALNTLAAQIEEQRFQKFLSQLGSCTAPSVSCANVAFVGSDSEDDS